MSKPILLLRLEGPLQSWGVRSRWDVRDTTLEPTKSGVIGLLGCALGYPMHAPELETLSDALRFGVRVEHPGMVVTDYQTITDYLPTAGGQYKSRGGVKSLEAIRAAGDAPATIISPRAYLEDAAFLVALEEREGYPDLLERCATALQRPRWPLFLGRKACVPTRPICEALTNAYSGLEDALQHHPWSWLGARGEVRRSQPTRLEAFVEVPDGTPGLEVALRQDRVQINPARIYGFRTVRRIPDIAFPGVQKGVTSCSTSPN
ncbi:MAG: type I-E CRISPR-associated protein Cas5/CasD [Armatimonadota bacterium]|nr:type I-E CRISPR-associated protein Cas5/CasD [Armatimonadota bacterium]